MLPLPPITIVPASAERRTVRVPVPSMFGLTLPVLAKSPAEISRSPAPASTTPVPIMANRPGPAVGSVLAFSTMSAPFDSMRPDNSMPSEDSAAMVPPPVVVMRAALKIRVAATGSPSPVATSDMPPAPVATSVPATEMASPSATIAAAVMLSLKETLSNVNCPPATALPVLLASA